MNAPSKLTRFSIRDLLFLVTIALMSVALWTANKNLREATIELKQLRTEAGHLTVSDDHNIHVIEVPTTGGYRWRWRIHLPEDKDFGLFLSKRMIPENGLPATGGRKSCARIGSMNEREFLLEVAVERNHDGPYVVAMRSLNNPSVIASFDEPPPDWLDGKAMARISVAGCGTTESVEAGQPLVLVRLRTANQKGPSEGLMLWISEYK